MEVKEYITKLVTDSRRAQCEFELFSQEKTDEIVRAIAKTVYDNAESLALMAVEETGMGVYSDKIKKNKGKAKIIWNSLKGVQSKGILSRNEMTGITEIARPVGVVGAVTPCTNPIVTPMCNAMFALKGGNSIIIAPHPRSKKCSAETVRLINESISALDAPVNLIQIIDEPSVELSTELMRAVDVVVATGGMPMVKAAYSSGKPAYGVGVGNVQCIFDREIDYLSAVKKVIEGREFDNGIICSGEQTVILPAEKYRNIINMFVGEGCYYIEDEEGVKKITETIFPNGIMNKKLVGVTAVKVAETAGIKVPEHTRVIIIKAPLTGKTSPLSKEKMCPVISAYAYDDFADAVDMAQKNLDVEGRGHSISIHSDDMNHIEYAGQTLTVARVLVNQICSTMNGGSFLNSLTPTTTLGCASWGNNSISENFSHRHLLNIIKIAYPKPNAYIPADEEIWSL